MFEVLHNTRRLRTSAPNCRLTPLAAGVALCFAGAASAATITVNDPSAFSVAGSCTIVDAVASINQGSLAAGSNCVNSGSAFGTGDTVDLSLLPSPKTITFQSAAGAALTVSKSVTISGSLDGLGPQVTIERGFASPGTRFRLIDTTANLALRGIALHHGHTTVNGGAIQANGLNHPTLTLTNSTVTGNFADGSGGGIYTNGALTLVDSTVVGNTASGANGGGGISASGAQGAVTTNDSTISGNMATNGNAGGIYAYTLAMTNSTVGGNSSSTSGGGVYAQNVTLLFCTIAENMAPFASGVGMGTVLVTPTSTAMATLIYGNNSGSDVDSSNARTLAGDHNLIGSFSHNISPVNTPLSCDPMLDVLADNGGPTQTYALKAGSCAIDAGPVFPPGTIPSDQRGSQYARRVGAATDIGAYEVQKDDRIFYDGFGL
jgi:predicted outer membrane repeat protein